MAYLFRLSTGHDTQGRKYYKRLDTNGTVYEITESEWQGMPSGWQQKIGDWNGASGLVNNIPSIFGGMGIRDATWMNGHQHYWQTLEPAPQNQKLDVYFYQIGNVEQSQELKAYFYPDGNVGNNQELQVLFYPDGNVTDIVQDQELKVFFYPNGNVENASNIIQELKVEFYPDGNVSDVAVSPSGDFKWWFGMKGKRKYGNSKVKRIKL